MEPFATADDYRLKYPGDEVEDVLLLRLLLEATDTICAELDSADFDYSDPSEAFTFRLMRVCCDATHRVVERMASAQPTGVSQESVTQTAGSYSGTRTYTYATPSMGVALTSQERRLLGVDGTACAFASPFSGGSARGGA